MFFTDREKAIYTPPHADRPFDPLALSNLLTVHSGNRLHDLIADHNAHGDVLRASADEEAKGLDPRPRAEVDEAAVLTAKADLELAGVARKAFGLPEFPDCTDAIALEMLFHFLDWLEKKSGTGDPPSPSPGSSDSTAP